MLLALTLTECQGGRICLHMPTYEYACSACGHEWEQAQRIVDPPVDLCPKCAKSTAHRLISRGTNFILKGGGWYSDLYASPSAAGKKAEAGSGGTDEAGTKADSKTPAGAEAKPAATEAKPSATESKPAAKNTTSTPTSSSS
jgi:putative FmdB family regulatory protein